MFLKFPLGNEQRIHRYQVSHGVYCLYVIISPLSVLLPLHSPAQHSIAILSQSLDRPWCLSDGTAYLSIWHQSEFPRSIHHNTFTIAEAKRVGKGGYMILHFPESPSFQYCLLWTIVLCVRTLYEHPKDARKINYISLYFNLQSI